MDFSHIISVTIPLHKGTTIPKAKRLEIDIVKAAGEGLHRTSITPLILR